MQPPTDNTTDITELRLVLRKLKTLGCTGIKVSFEDEGAQINEIITMRYITSIENIELSVKIGGCEAKRDIVECIHLCADTIVAPMVESGFAIKKYVDAIYSIGYCNKKSFNLETISGYNNLSEILKATNKSVDSLTFGRVDFAASLKREREFANSPQCYEFVENTFIKARQYDLMCNLGGAISKDSKRFIEALYSKNLLDFFETRYVIICVHKMNFENFEEIIYYSNLFEVEWLKYIATRYAYYSSKDSARIQMIENRMNAAAAAAAAI